MPPGPATTTRLPGLDTLRALAILLVMTFHLGAYLPEALEPVAKVGWMGVDLFFVLSGYLIGLQLMRPYLHQSVPSLREFYRRRAFRILPTYLTVVALYFVVPVWRERPGLSPLWQFLTFTENLFVDYANHKAFSHVWSLCVEEHFYLIVPLVVLIAMRRPSGRLAVSLFGLFVALGIGCRTYALFHSLHSLAVTDEHWYVLYYEHLYYPTWNRLDGLIAGVGLACLQTFRPLFWNRLRHHGSLLAGSACTLLAMSCWLLNGRNESDTGVAAWGAVLGFPLIALSFGLLVASSTGLYGPLARWRVPGAQGLATLAFTLYLTHKEAVQLVRLWLPNATRERDLQALFLYCAACLLCALPLHWLVERPFLGLRRGRIEVVSELKDDPAL